MEVSHSWHTPPVAKKIFRQRSITCLILNLNNKWFPFHRFFFTAFQRSGLGPARWSA